MLLFKLLVCAAVRDARVLSRVYPQSRELFSCSVVSDFLRPRGLQRARPPCHIPPITSPKVAQTHVHQVSDVTQPSHPLSSPSPPAFKLYQHEGLFQ